MTHATLWFHDEQSKGHDSNFHGFHSPCANERMGDPPQQTHILSHGSRCVTETIEHFGGREEGWRQQRPGSRSFTKQYENRVNPPFLPRLQGSSDEHLDCAETTSRRVHVQSDSQEPQASASKGDPRNTPPGRGGATLTEVSVHTQRRSIIHPPSAEHAEPSGSLECPAPRRSTPPRDDVPSW